MATLTLSRSAEAGRLKAPHRQRFFFGSLGIFLFVASWQSVSILELAPSTMLPAPTDVLASMLELASTPVGGATLIGHLGESLKKFVLSFVIGAALGTLLGLVLGRSFIARITLGMLLELFRYIPPIAWVPFAILWFGATLLAPVFVVATGVFTICAVNAYSGVALVPRNLIEAADTLGASRVRTLVEVLLPGAVPPIVAGLRVAAGVGWQSLVGAELIVGSAGLGLLMVRAQQNLETDIVVAAMVVIGVVGACIDYVLRTTELHIKRRWGR